MSIYKLFGAGTGGAEESLANLDVQFDGEIVAMSGTIYADLDAADEIVIAEVSFLSSNTWATNDARGSLFMMVNNLAIVTSGSSPGTNHSVSGLFVPITAGERIHLHISATAGVISQTNVYVYVRDGTPTELRRRR